jgi:hypothetical protein
MAKLRRTESATIEVRAADAQFVTTAQPGTNVTNTSASALLTGPSTPRATRATKTTITTSAA